MKYNIECLCGNIKNIDIEIWDYHKLFCSMCKKRNPVLKNLDGDVLIEPSDLNLCHSCDEIVLPIGRASPICQPCIDDGVHKRDIPNRYKGKNNLESKVVIPLGWEENKLAIDKIINASKRKGNKISGEAAKQQFYKIKSKNIPNECSECDNGVKWLHFNLFPGYYTLICTNSDKGCEFKENWSWD